MILFEVPLLLDPLSTLIDLEIDADGDRVDVKTYVHSEIHQGPPFVHVALEHARLHPRRHHNLWMSGYHSYHPG